MSAPQLFYRITQIRSTIGLPETYKKTLNALGLRKRGGIVYRPVDGETAGQILKVKNLVDVKVENEYKSITDIRRERKPIKGYTVEKRV